MFSSNENTEVNNGSNEKNKKEQMKKLNIAVFALLCIVLIAVVGTITFNKHGDLWIVKMSSSMALRASENSEKSIIHINEKQYLPWIDEINDNKERYLDHKIKIEGMYAEETEDGEIHHHVYRIGPGCCSHHGNKSGFLFTSSDGEYPKDNEWIEVVGTLKEVPHDGETILVLEDAIVTIKAERGLESVKH